MIQLFSPYSVVLLLVLLSGCPLGFKTTSNTATNRIMVSSTPSESDERERLLDNARHFLPNQAQKKALLREIKQQEKNYDARAHLLRRDIPATANRYHSEMVNTTALSFRASALYATDLIDSEVPEYQERAYEILAVVLDHQDQRPGSKTYGLWPYLLEEPLEKMKKPDFNWADFMGVALLETYLRHYEDLPKDLRKGMEEALVHASRAIKKRDIKPDYTNIAIMGTLVTYLTGHLLDLPDLQQYADMRLRRFYEYTLKLGGFEEYNSPNYTKIALDELCRMRQYILEPEAKRMVDECYTIGWEVLASHFHPSSAQLAGPHSRSASTLLKKDFYNLLYGGSQGMVDYQRAQLPAGYYKLQHQIPESLLDHFLRLPESRVEVDTFSGGKNPVVGYTYLHPQYCVGTANRSTTWQQRRPWIAYWGTPERPRYLQPKLLHDKVEFAAGNIFSTQDKNCTLTTLDLATDGGDYHLSFDRLPDGVFQSKDLRLRFEIGGSDLFSKITITDDAIHLRDDEVQVDIQLLHAAFDHQEISHLEKGQGQGKCWVDLIIYSGEKKKFDLNKMQQATFGWSTRIYTSDDDRSLPTARATVSNQRIDLQWEGLQLSAPIKPGTEEQLQRSFSSEGSAQ